MEAAYSGIAIVEYQQSPRMPQLAIAGIPSMFLGRTAPQLMFERFPHPLIGNKAIPILDQGDPRQVDVSSVLSAFTQNVKILLDKNELFAGSKLQVWNDGRRVLPNGEIYVNVYLSVDGIPAMLVEGEIEDRIEIYRSGMVATRLAIRHDPDDGISSMITNLFSRAALYEAHIRLVEEVDRGKNLDCKVPQYNGPYGALLPPLINSREQIRSTVLLDYCRQLILDNAEKSQHLSAGHYRDFAITCSIDDAIPLKKKLEDGLKVNKATAKFLQEEATLVTASLILEPRVAQTESKNSLQTNASKQQFLLCTRAEPEGSLEISLECP